MNIRRQIIYYYFLQRTIFWILVLITLCSFVWYGYAISQAVWDTSARLVIEKELGSVRSYVGDLQAAAVSKRSIITMDFVKDLGFRETAVTFITRNPLGTGV